MTYIAIEAQNLSKRYRIGARQESYKTLRDTLSRALLSPVRAVRNRWKRLDADDIPDTVWALRDLSFQVEQGTVLGIVGHNGAGKSTLLKILARITEPTAGRAILRGRVGSLLEIGTGFHGELTGRENLYLSGAILGMRRAEIGRKFDEIVAFADVEQFIDTPVKRYSSGMYLRLGFAVAAHLDPEILLVDEVLAVGDVAFQKRCLGKIGEIAGAGRTVLLVSHNLTTVNDLCSSALLIDHGHLAAQGPTSKVVEEYLRRQGSISHEYRVKTANGDRRKDFELLQLRVTDAAGSSRPAFVWDEDFLVTIDYALAESIRNLRVGFQLENRWGHVVFRTGDADWIPALAETRAPGRYRSTCRIPGKLLNVGDYFVSLRVDVPHTRWVFWKDRLIRFSVGQADIPGGQYTEAAIRPEFVWDHQGAAGPS
ncbi:MAG: ABC transporter ATP-binding protein [bacterium]|nr:ABC transporter ATP-binding protein [bacterium]